MARAESMAAIDAALQGVPTTNASAQQNTASPVAPHPAPGVEAPTPVSNAGKMTADEKRFIDAQRQARTDEEKRAEKFNDQEQAKQGALQKSASATVNAAKGIARETGFTLAGLPTPGSLVLPLVILGIFFFLLLPVNGHTRLVWLWLVLTNNAEISQQSSGGATPITSNSPDFGGGAGGSFDTSGTPSATPASNASSSSNNSSPYGTQLPTWGDLGQWLNNLGSYAEEIL